MKRVLLGLALALCSPASAGLQQVDVGPSDLAWLPLHGPRASIRLHDGVDPASLGNLLDGATPLASAPIWRVPISRIPALRAHPAVASVWGLPQQTPPPDDADLPPSTPDFTAQQSWRTDLGITPLTWWPGAGGLGVRVADIEYAFDTQHEDLANNPAEAVGGVGWVEYTYHGNASLGLVGASDDGFGTTGGAPLSELVVVHPIDALGDYDVAIAVELATAVLRPGDVLLIEQQARTGIGLGPVTVEPGTWEAVRRAVDAGIHVIEPAGNGAVNLDDPRLDGWFDPSNDPGSILVGAAAPGTRTWNTRSTYGQRVHLFADGGQLFAPSHPDGPTDAFFPASDARQAYTSRFGGTSGASAQIAGLVASVQGIAFELRDGALDPRVLRSWLVQTGLPQDPTSASEHPIGVRPDAQRVVRAWLTW